MFSLNDAWRRRSRPSRPSSVGQKWSYLFLRIELQGALTEAMKLYPLMKLKVFVDDITAFMEGRNEELAGIANYMRIGSRKLLRMGSVLRECGDAKP